MKKQFGQFFTTNADYILKGLEKYIKAKKASDPFAGSGDLMTWAKKHKAKSIMGFDVDKKLVSKTISYNDTLKNHKKYDFVITNPPYLNINKASAKTKQNYFKNSGFEDLYQISLNSIMDSNEGIVIVPINFLSAENSRKIRNKFFAKFEIVEMNYFRQQVFADTTYNVIAFYYRTKKKSSDQFAIPTKIYPEGVGAKIILDKKYNWAIGGEITQQINEHDNELGIYRLTEAHVNAAKGKNKVKAAFNHVKTQKEILVNDELASLINRNIILLKAIDSGTPQGQIALEDITEYKINCLISKPTSRHQIYLIFGKLVPIQQQKKIIVLFNQQIRDLRSKYLSLFLSNYRDKDRKRISFDFAYKLINIIHSGLDPVF